MIEQNGFSKVCKLSFLKEKQGERFLVNDIEIAVFKVDGEVYALNNICAHQHAAIIYDGFVEDCKVTCPAHGWEYDLKTGEKAEGKRGIEAYEVKVIDDEVFVNVRRKT